MGNENDSGSDDITIVTTKCPRLNQRNFRTRKYVDDVVPDLEVVVVYHGDTAVSVSCNDGRPDSDVCGYLKQKERTCIYKAPKKLE